MVRNGSTFNLLTCVLVYVDDIEAHFQQAKSQRSGGDEPSESYAQWCDKLLREDLPPHWEPVLDTHK